jgi:hypothetical protein
MRKIFVALLVGLLFIGAASATVPGNQFPPKPPVKQPIGCAESCALAFGDAHASIDKCLVSAANDGTTVGTGKDATTKTLVVYADVKSTTVQIDDAKVDPLSVSISKGSAVAQVSGFINVDTKKFDDHNGPGMNFNGPQNHEAPKSASVAVIANSESNAFNAAMGSIKAEGNTVTFNTADVCVNEHKLSADATAGSISTGEAVGVPGQGTNSVLDDLYKDLACFDCEKETPK